VHGAWCMVVAGGAGGAGRAGASQGQPGRASVNPGFRVRYIVVEFAGFSLEILTVPWIRRAAYSANLEAGGQPHATAFSRGGCRQWMGLGDRRHVCANRLPSPRLGSARLDAFLTGMSGCPPTPSPNGPSGFAPAVCDPSTENHSASAESELPPTRNAHAGW
jgi:hypothetical protein